MSERNDEYLVRRNDKIMGSKLPSKEQVLQYFLYQHEIKRESIKKSAILTLNAVNPFWVKARIPTCLSYRCIAKIESLFQAYVKIRKNKLRRTDAQKKREASYTAELKNLFDIAHGNAFNQITIAEDKLFLKAQRESGRKGSMGSVDRKLAKKEKQADKKAQAHDKRCAKAKAQTAEVEEKAILSSSSTSPQHSSSESDSDYFLPKSESCSVIGFINQQDLADAGCSIATNKNSSRRVEKKRKLDPLTPKVSAALDRTNTTDRAATFILAEAAKSFGHSVENSSLSRSTIRRKRIKAREGIAANIKANFQPNDPLTIHWDGKLFAELGFTKKVDRLPIIVTGIDIEQLLGVPRLISGTGEAQAEAAFQAVTEWNLQPHVKSMSFDTTSANTGSYKGACVLLEKLFGKNLLRLACRHHIHELVLGSAFSACFEEKKQPEEPLFKKFQSDWPILNHEEYKYGTDDEEVMCTVENDRDDVVQFCRQQLKTFHPREDYKELLELVMVFLGVLPSDDMKFRKPGAISDCRWMAKSLYCLKMFLFREQLLITTEQLVGLKNVSIFICLIYVKHWTLAAVPTSAPLNDLDLLKKLNSYRKVHPGIGLKTSATFLRHLWYLSAELVPLSLFNQDISLKEKRKMIIAMKENSCAYKTRKLEVSISDVDDVVKKGISDFFSKKSVDFFSILGLDSSFLDVDSLQWDGLVAFKRAEKIIQHLKVTNDHAERGVALVQKYNNALTKNEESKQFLLQVVSEHRKTFPTPAKEYFLKNA